MTPWVADWLRAFGTTVAVEAAIAAPLLTRVEPRLARRLAGLMLLNLATHPLVWFLFPGLTAAYPVRVALSEVWALLAESAGYLVIWPQLGFIRAALISLVANGASFALGLLLL